MGGKPIKDYYYAGGIRLVSPEGTRIKIDYARITSEVEGMAWQGIIRIAGPMPPTLRAMLGGGVTVHTDDGAIGKAYATGDFAEGVWTVTLEGKK